MTVVLNLFGAPTIARGGEAHALHFERRTQLLVYLALKRTWVARAELAALLWPDQDTQARQYQSAQGVVPAAGRAGCRADRSSDQARCASRRDTDVHDFESALREQRIADALALRRGDLLAGFDDDSNEAWSGWLHFERDRLRSAWRTAAAQHLAGELEATEADRSRGAAAGRGSAR